jgi:hypothetical protein
MPDIDSTFGLLEQRLATLPIVARARVMPSSDGTLLAEALLDGMLIRARADQQGLADAGYEAAARCPRVQRMLATEIRRLASQIAPGIHVARCRVLAEQGGAVATIEIAETGLRW